MRGKDKTACLSRSQQIHYYNMASLYEDNLSTKDNRTHPSIRTNITEEYEDNLSTRDKWSMCPLLRSFTVSLQGTLLLYEDNLSTTKHSHYYWMRTTSLQETAKCSHYYCMRRASPHAHVSMHIPNITPPTIHKYIVIPCRYLLKLRPQSAHMSNTTTLWSQLSSTANRGSLEKGEKTVDSNLVSSPYTHYSHPPLEDWRAWYILQCACVLCTFWDYKVCCGKIWFNKPHTPWDSREFMWAWCYSQTEM